MSELAKALHKAQGQIEGAKKDSANPHFKSKYADLASVWEACRPALQSNGLSVAQFCRVTEAGAVLVTRLAHVSGDWLEGEIPLLNGKGDMQGLGSALTYARRYGLAAMVGVCPEDDDGNAASEKPKAPALPEGFAEWAADFEAAADNGIAALKAAWEASKPEYRAALPAADRERLKTKAAKAGA
jgi:hypothetical protein